MWDKSSPLFKSAGQSNGAGRFNPPHRTREVKTTTTTNRLKSNRPIYSPQEENKESSNLLREISNMFTGHKTQTAPIIVHGMSQKGIQQWLQNHLDYKNHGGSFHFVFLKMWQKKQLRYLWLQETTNILF
jgi:hypothetical protein